MITPLLRCLAAISAVSLSCSLLAAEAPKAKATPKTPSKAAAKTTTAKKAEPQPPAPTLANVPYGTHERQVLDFWKAESDQPTPVLFFIHGGGF